MLFVLTEPKRRLRSVARRRTIDKRDQSSLILPRLEKFVKQFVNTKIARAMRELCGNSAGTTLGGGV